MARSHRQRVGHDHERAALAHLRQAGLELIRRNFRCRRGEIDLVMRDGDVLAFVEVRYRRSNPYTTAAASVTPAKQQRLVHAAEFFLAMQPQHRHRAVRFDVVAIDAGQTDTTITWIKDAFRPH